LPTADPEIRPNVKPFNQARGDQFHKQDAEFLSKRLQTEADWKAKLTRTLQALFWSGSMICEAAARWLPAMASPLQRPPEPVSAGTDGRPAPRTL
jgi:hypothetical protein